MTIFVFLIRSGIIFSNESGTERTQPVYSEVRIYAADQSDFRRMSEAGLIIDHGTRKPGIYLDAWLSEYEIDLLKRSGVRFEIITEDWDEYYKNLPIMNQNEINAQMREAKVKDNVSHSIYGTMGGYLKYSEVVAKLDSMRSEYPQLISQKFSIGNTFQGRAMWVVRVTKNPDAPSGRPEVFYNALIHAREPESMETQMYYFYWLLENYGTDPVATYILNNREIYWMPVFNADGYVYNETTNPNGGGMWRCNRHGNGSCGWVDLNRNFGIYQFWNSSNGGSSTDSCAGGQSTYRGTSPFSEAETRNVMNFVSSRNFNSAFNAHTYGNYLLKPWDYIDPLPTPDDYKFNQFLSDMSEKSNYTTGSASQTLGYFVRGGTSDWFYNDSAHSGHNIFSVLPETGPSFWPAQNEIIPLARNMLFSNQYMSLIAGPFVNPVSKNFSQENYNPGESGNLKVVVKNKGLLNASNVRIILTPASAGLTIPVQQYSFSNINSFASDSVSFNFTAGNSVPVNTALKANLKIEMYTIVIYSEQIYVLIGNGNIVLNDNAEAAFSNWTTNQSWGITSSQSNSPTHSFTDSPAGQYNDNTNNSMTLANAISISSSSVVKISFYHKYSTEQGFDFCNFEVSDALDTSWQTIKSYTGSLSAWTPESFNLTEYAAGSSQIKIRFRLSSDEIVSDDGWYIDDIKIISYNEGPVGIPADIQTAGSFALRQNYPNPFNPSTAISYSIPVNSFVELKIYDILGNEVMTLVSQKQIAGNYSVNFEGSNLSSGTYFYRLTAGEFTESKTMMLLK
ncbi:MAG: T9SS type A sorting domain-containing protein [Ignavibacteria bacterium]|nr:T9SS type A sorting domain-containing protein [Ignavibacteria bacterium]